MGAPQEAPGGPQPGAPKPDDEIAVTPVQSEEVAVTTAPAERVEGFGAHAAQNLKDKRDAEAPADGSAAPAPTEPPPIPGTQKYAKSFTEDFLAGLGMSPVSTGLTGKLPEYVLPENADMAARFLKNVGTFTGDIPTILASMVAGAAAGTAAGAPAGPFTAVAGLATGAGLGLTAGAFGIAPAVREHYMRNLLRNGTSWREFWPDLMADVWTAAKGTALGAATVATGGAASAAATSLGPIGAAATGLGAEVAAMTGIGAAMEGHVPTLQELGDNAAFILAFHGLANATKVGIDGAKAVSEKIGDVWAKTGIKPGDLTEQARQDPVLHQQIISADGKLPEKLAPLQQKQAANHSLIKDSTPELVPAKVPEQLGTLHPVLSPEFKPDMVPRVPAAEPRPPLEPEPTLSEEKAAKDAGTTDQTPVDKSEVLGRIGEKPQTAWWKPGAVREALIDRLNPVKRVMDALTGNGELRAEDDVHSLLSRGRDVSRHVEFLWNNGFKDGLRGPGQIFADHPGDVQGLKAYVVAHRALEIDGKGIESGFSEQQLDKARDYVSQNGSKYEKSAQDLYAFQNRMLENAEKDGLLKPGEAAKHAAENQRYIPWNRIDPEREGQGSGTGKGTKPIKALKGSDLKNVDPFEQMLRNTTNWIQRGVMNDAAVKFQDAIDKAGQTENLAPKAPNAKLMIPADEHERIAADDPSVSFVSVPPQVGPNMMYAMREGKPDIRIVGDSIAGAFRADPYSADAIIKMLGIPTATLRAGAVHYSLPFDLKHFTRDFTNAPLYTNNKFIPVLDNVLGAMHFVLGRLSSNDMMRAYTESGAFKGHTSELIERIQSNVWDNSKQSGYFDSQTNVVRTPLDLFSLYSKAMTKLVETAANAAPYREFEKAIGNGKSVAEAARDSRALTPDTNIVAANQTVRTIGALNAFWSYRMKGMDMMAQALKDNPGEFIKRGVINIGLPTVYAWNQNKDKDWYKNASDTDRDLNWLIADPLAKDSYGNPVIHKVPKPFEPGILFGSSLERALNWMHDKDPEALERSFHGFGGAVFDAAVPLPYSNVLKPVVEQTFNKGLLSQVPLIPERMKNASPNQQYFDYTTDTARAMGKALQLVPMFDHPGSIASPIVLENYIRSWAGGTGMQLLKAADTLTRPKDAPVKPADGVADGAFAQAFNLRWPSARQAVSNFYENMNEIDRYKSDYRLMKSRGDAEGMARFENTWMSQEASLKFSNYQKSISNLEHSKDEIYRDPNRSAQDKRNLLDRTEVLITQIANQANKEFHQYREEFKRGNK